jgi:hypothetical protein
MRSTSWTLRQPLWDSRTVIAIVVIVLAPLAAILWLWWRRLQFQVARLPI